MFYYIRTFGCQMNQHDSEYLAGLLDKHGYNPTETLADADVIVVNTCTVRESAANKIFGFLDSLIPYKRMKKELRIAVVGCLVSEQALVDQLLLKRRHIDLVLGTRSLDRLPTYLDRLLVESGPIVDIDLDAPVAAGRMYRRDDPYRAYITITYGCDNFCSYCIVPQVRGRESSRPMAEILAETRELVANGVKEITLLGQNVNSYGKGLSAQENFANLLRTLPEIEGLARIRYMTSHPKDFSDEILDAIEASDKICRHFHLPVQAGSDRILKEMNRHYDRTYYLSLMEKIKHRFKDPVLTTDIIVGFPGETEADFEDTMDLMRRVRYDSAYTFLYSPRHGTKAAEMENPISSSVKKERLQRLMALQNEVSLEKNRAMVGKRYILLGEGKSSPDDTMQSGRTDGNKLVHFPSDADYNGKMVEVEITKAHTWSMQGRLWNKGG